MRSDNQPVFMIGVAAQLCSVHPQTLRQYERLGRRAWVWPGWPARWAWAQVLATSS